MHRWDGTRMHLWNGTGIHYRTALEKAFGGGFIPWKSQLAAPLWHPPASSCPWHSPAGTRGQIPVTYGYPPGSSLSPGHFPKFLGLSLDDPCPFQCPTETPQTPTLTTALPAAGRRGIHGLFGIHAGFVRAIPVAWLSMHKWPSMHPDAIWGANYREHARNRGNYSRKLAV